MSLPVADDQSGVALVAHRPSGREGVGVQADDRKGFGQVACAMWCLLGGTRGNSLSDRRAGCSRACLAGDPRAEGDPMSGTPVEHLDVVVVGAGISGIGAGRYLGVEHPPEDLRGAGGSCGLRWDVGPVPLPRHPLGLRPAHLRLRLRSVARQGGDRLGSPDPGLPASHRARDRGRAAHPLPPPGARSRLVEPGRPLAPRRRAHRHGGAGADQCRLDLLRQRLLPLRRGVHPALRGPGGLRGHDRAPAAVAGGPRPRRQARRRDRQRGHGRHAGPGSGRDGCARDAPAAHAELHPPGAP